MRLRIGNRTYEGRAVDLRSPTGSVDGRSIFAAVSEDRADLSGETNPSTDGRTGAATPPARAGSEIVVECADPSPVHGRVGYVHAGTTVRVRTALAAAARSRGLSSPQDDVLASVRRQLEDLEVPERPDVATARERLAGTEAAVERLRERVAALRGRVTAAREADRDPADAEAALADAVRELSERETELAAAREALERTRERARETRDRRERKRRLEDRAANLERDARAHLVGEVATAFRDALAALPGDGPVASDGPLTDRRRQGGATETGTTAIDGAATRASRSPDTADGPRIPDIDDVSAALAIGRVADLRAPVVLDCDRFPDATAAADWLGASVIRL